MVMEAREGEREREGGREKKKEKEKWKRGFCNSGGKGGLKGGEGIGIKESSCTMYRHKFLMMNVISVYV